MDLLTFKICSAQSLIVCMFSRATHSISWHSSDMVIPKVNWRNPMELRRAAQAFSGRIVSSRIDAVKLMNVQDNSLDTWVVRPPTSTCQYVCSDGIVSTIGLDWKKTTPKSVEELNALIFQTTATEKSYSWDKNNCQHFAEELYINCTSE